MSTPRPGRAAAESARDVALATLEAVAHRDGYANLVLPGLLRRSGLSPADRALATELAYGTLRWQGSIDRLLEPCLDRPLASLQPQLPPLLRLGAYQMWRTRIPAHAAVSSTVEQAKARGLERAAGLVNAVLRQVGRRLQEPDPLRLAEESDPWQRLALEHAHPRWIVDEFAAALAGDLEETARALAADNVAAPVHLVARPGRIERAELLGQAGARARPGRWSDFAVILGGGDPGRLAAVRDGRAAVQDEGSQLVAVALHRSAPPGLRIDLAAGPGGKAALLAGLGGSQSRLLGLEPSAHRAALVRRSGVAVVRGDGRQPPIAPGSAAAVLLDAPCTGLGALRRRPEARWRRQPADLAALTVLQRELLSAALRLVPVGGVVGYAVCSPAVAEADPGSLPGTSRLDAVAAAGLPAGQGFEAGDGRLQVWPHRHGGDGLSLVLYRREI